MTSERAERTVSVNDTDKFCEAVCAFANDMPDNKQNGYLLVGVHDDGRLSGLKATDSLLKNLAAIRSVRDYRSTGPTMFHQYAARIELLNSGGLYGRVNQWKKKGLFLQRNLLWCAAEHEMVRSKASNGAHQNLRRCAAF